MQRFIILLRDVRENASEIIEFAYRRIHPRQPFASIERIHGKDVNIQTRCHLCEYRLPLRPS